MKKVLIAFVASLGLATMAFAGQVTWQAGLFDSSWANADCYLLATTSSTITAQNIADYITTNGLNAYTGTDVWNANNSNLSFGGDAITMTEDSGNYYATGTSGNFSTAGTYYCYLLVISKDGKTFGVTSQASVTITGTDSNATPQSIDSWIVENETLSLTTGNVPEPTALALLALGIAGLALRRRA